MTVSKITASKVYIAPISNGLGDLICSLPVVQILIKSGRETHLVLRSGAQQGLESRISGLAGTVLESDLPDLTAEPDSQLINLRDHPLQTDHVWGSESFLNQYPNFCIDDVIGTIAEDYGLGRDFETLTPLKHQHDQRAAGKILFVPGARGSQKCWPAKEWLALAKKLQANDMDCAILGQPTADPLVKILIDQGLPWIETAELVDALDAISSANAVVGVDTGLMHMAVHQHIPTVALFRYNAVFARKKRHVRTYLAPKCPDSCRQAEFDTDCHKQLSFNRVEEGGTEYFYWSSWHCQEAEANHCMAKITCGEIYEALFDLTYAKR
jgi:hypothetical protein